MLLISCIAQMHEKLFKSEFTLVIEGKNIFNFRLVEKREFYKSWEIGEDFDCVEWWCFGGNTKAVVYPRRFPSRYAHVRRLRYGRVRTRFMQHSKKMCRCVTDIHRHSSVKAMGLRVTTYLTPFHNTIAGVMVRDPTQHIRRMYNRIINTQASKTLWLNK